MIDVDTVTLEDNNTYAIAKNINNYIFLVNVDDPEDVCIRKITNEDGQDYISPLDNEEELAKALELFK